MIVCHCKCVSDKKILKYNNLTDVMRECRAGTGCGNCIPLICELIKEKTNTKNVLNDLKSEMEGSK